MLYTCAPASTKFGKTHNAVKTRKTQTIARCKDPKQPKKEHKIADGIYHTECSNESYPFVLVHGGKVVSRLNPETYKIKAVPSAEGAHEARKVSRLFDGRIDLLEDSERARKFHAALRASGWQHLEVESS